MFFWWISPHKNRRPQSSCTPRSEVKAKACCFSTPDPVWHFDLSLPGSPEASWCLFFFTAVYVYAKPQEADWEQAEHWSPVVKGRIYGGPTEKLSLTVSRYELVFMSWKEFGWEWRGGAGRKTWGRNQWKWWWKHRETSIHLFTSENYRFYTYIHCPHWRKYVNLFQTQR